MELSKIVKYINEKLAAEMKTYSELEVHLDSVIDEINTRLNAKFPVFSEFNSTDYPTQYPNYNFFPDKYIRTVVVVGTAAKFFETDEEGISSATKYDQDYLKNLFYMERDYSALVPLEFQADNTGSLVHEEDDDDYLLTNPDFFVF